MSNLCHLQLNAADLAKSAAFYDLLLPALGWKKEMAEDDLVGYVDPDDSWLFIGQTEERFQPDNFHRKRTGLNHLAFRAGSKEAVDRFHDLLQGHGVAVLYGGPAEHPEYGEGYYAVYFEDPDRIKLEVCYYPND